MNAFGSSTLFDRMVARTDAVLPGFSLLLEPAFGGWAEEVTEYAAPRPVREFDAAAPSPPSAPVLPARRIEPESGPPPRHSIEDKEGRSTVLAPSPVKRETPAEASAPTPVGPPRTPPSRVRTVHEICTVERPGVEVWDAVKPAFVEATVGRMPEGSVPEVREIETTIAVPVDRPVAVPAPGRRTTVLAPQQSAQPILVVKPDLPLSIPEPMRRPAVSPAPQAPEPVIHVTIGRLEIRATEKPKPARAKDRAPQGPSLEQYLAKRRGDAS